MMAILTKMAVLEILMHPHVGRQPLSNNNDNNKNWYDNHDNPDNHDNEKKC